MCFKFPVFILAAMLFVSVEARAEDQAFRFSLFDVETFDKADCGAGENGKIICTTSCIANAKLIALGQPLLRAESATITLSFKDPIKRNETGEMQFSFYFSGSQREGKVIETKDSVLSVSCNQIKIIRSSVECSDESRSSSCGGKRFIFESYSPFRLRAYHINMSVNKF